MISFKMENIYSQSVQVVGQKVQAEPLTFW